MWESHGQVPAPMKKKEGLNLDLLQILVEYLQIRVCHSFLSGEKMGNFDLWGKCPESQKGPMGQEKHILLSSTPSPFDQSI